MISVDRDGASAVVAMLWGCGGAMASNFASVLSKLLLRNRTWQGDFVVDEKSHVPLRFVQTKSVRMRGSIVIHTSQM